LNDYATGVWRRKTCGLALASLLPLASTCPAVLSSAALEKIFGVVGEVAEDLQHLSNWSNDDTSAANQRQSAIAANFWSAYLDDVEALMAECDEAGDNETLGGSTRAIIDEERQLASRLNRSPVRGSGGPPQDQAVAALSPGLQRLLAGISTDRIAGLDIVAFLRSKLDETAARIGVDALREAISHVDPSIRRMVGLEA